MQMASITFSYNFTIPSELLPYSIVGGQNQFPRVMHACPYQYRPPKERAHKILCTLGRGASSGVLQVQKPVRFIIILNWRNIPIHSNKTVTFSYGQYSKAVVTLLITSIYILICLFIRGDLEEGQSCPRPHMPPTSEYLAIFVYVYTNTRSIIKCNFCTIT